MEARQPVTNERLVTTVLFLVVIFSFGLMSAARWTISSKTISAEEKRRLASCPHLRMNVQSIEAFPAGFNSFFNDRFAFRNALLSAVSLAKYKVFGCSSTPNVVIGKNDWLFFNDGGDKEVLRGWPPADPAELERCVKLFEARRAWLAARGIRYLVFFPPSKGNIYREQVPPEYGLVREKVHMDDLIEALRANTSVEIVDVRPALLRSKDRGILYYKTDTHWNLLGAFVAYREVANRLKDWFPTIKPLTFEDVGIRELRFGEGDLASMMGLCNLLPEVNLVAYVKNPRARTSADMKIPDFNDQLHQKDPFATEVEDAKLPKALFLRDSFMQMARTYFSENFRRIRYAWQFDLPVDVVEREKPDVVVQEITERWLVRSSYFVNPPELEKFTPREHLAIRRGNEQLAQTKSVRASGTN